MRRALLGAIFLWAGALLVAGRPGSHRSAPEESVSTFKVAGLAFVIPDRWTKKPAETASRAAQWGIAPPRGQGGEVAEVVVFFFGPGVGGTARENVDAWAGTITGSDGRAAAAAPQSRVVAGHMITQVTLSGTYAQTTLQPGMPPTLKPAYSLLGAVVENPAGNLYWRLTGPSAEVAVLAPIFTKVLDSLKPQVDKP